MFPPLSPLRFPRTLGFLVSNLFRNSFTRSQRSLSCTSTPPQRLLPSCAAFSCRVLGRPEATEKAPRLSFPDPSAFSDEVTLLFTTLSSRVEGVLPYFPRSPILRVWLPSRWCSRPSSLEASFSSPHSWASPFRAFLLPRGRKRVSPFSLRSRAFLQTLIGFEAAPQRLCSPQESRVSFCLPKD